VVACGSPGGSAAGASGALRRECRATATRGEGSDGWRAEVNSRRLLRRLHACVQLS
jgi:hypothetical protein